MKMKTGFTVCVFYKINTMSGKNVVLSFYTNICISIALNFCVKKSFINFAYNGFSNNFVMTKLWRNILKMSFQKATFSSLFWFYNGLLWMKAETKFNVLMEGYFKPASF